MNKFSLILLILLAPSVLLCVKEQCIDITSSLSDSCVERLIDLSRKENSIRSWCNHSFRGEVALDKADLYIENQQYESALRNCLIARRSFYKANNMSCYLQSLIKTSYVYSLLSRPGEAKHYLEIVFRYNALLNDVQRECLSDIKTIIYSNKFSCALGVPDLPAVSFHEIDYYKTSGLIYKCTTLGVFVLLLLLVVYKSHQSVKIEIQDVPCDDYKNIARSQIELLYNFVNANISVNYAASAKKYLSEYISDKNTFIITTKKSFEFLFPRYTDFLKSSNLSDEEILCCCLLVMGFKGKTISAYFGWTRGYEKFVGIRNKMGILGSSQNIDTFLQKKFKKLGYKSIRQ